MSKRLRNGLILVLLCGGLSLGMLHAQEAGALATPEAVAAERERSMEEATSFYNIVFGHGMMKLAVWLALFATSFVSVAFMVDSFLRVRREKLLPPHLIGGVREALNNGDLDTAIHLCETNPGQLSNILMAGFTNIAEGYETVQEAVSAATDLESERLLQRIGYLYTCGQVAPLMGLLGTVLGILMAFKGLATAGAEKETQLAVAISVALWCTMAGLSIAIPSMFGHSIFKNIATQRLLESEATVLDLMKHLRGAEVDTAAEGEAEDVAEDLAD